MAAINLDGFEATYTTVPGLVVNSLVDITGEDDSTVIDLGSTEQPYFVAMMAKLVGSAAGNTGAVDFYVRWSDDGTPSSDSTNDVPMGAVFLNGTTAVEKGWVFPVEARYCIIRAHNRSGASMETTGNTVTYAEISQVST